jgi:hypothetical protein
MPEYFYHPKNVYPVGAALQKCYQHGQWISVIFPIQRHENAQERPARAFRQLKKLSQTSCFLHGKTSDKNFSCKIRTI